MLIAAIPTDEGWSMTDHMRSEMVEDALSMAIARRQPGSDLLHHSDDYQKLLTDHGMTPSMNGKGDCWDNAPTESFGATDKK